MAQSVSPVPAGFRTVAPQLVCSGAADALAFYRQAFGATEIRRTETPDGKIVHAGMQAAMAAQPGARQ